MFALPGDIDNVSAALYKEVEINAAVLSDYSVLVLPPVKDLLNEGAPLFNKDGKLIGITTQRYAEHHERAGVNVASVINVKGKPPYDPKRMNTIPSVDSAKKGEEELNKQAETDVTVPFPEEKGWVKIAEEVHSVTDKNVYTDFNLGLNINRCRLRTKYKPADKANLDLRINVYRREWDLETSQYRQSISLKEITITKEGLSADDLSLPYGSYRLEVKHAEGDLYSIIIEQKEPN